MSEPGRALRRARYLYAIVLLQLAAGCSGWRRLPGSSLERAEGEWLGHARVFLRDGTVLEFQNASIRPDSIIEPATATFSRLAVARSDVARVETRSPELATTFLLGMLAPVAFALLYVAAVQAGRD